MMLRHCPLSGGDVGAWRIAMASTLGGASHLAAPWLERWTGARELSFDLGAAEGCASMEGEIDIRAVRDEDSSSLRARSD